MEQGREGPAVSRDAELEALTQLDTAELLERYRKTGDADVKWAIVLQHVDLVRSIVKQVRGVYAEFAQTEDIIHEGILALLDAVDKFDPDRGVKFSTYVVKRIRGMIIDVARRQDWSPRQLRQRAARIAQAEERLANSLGRTPTDREMADSLGLSLEQYEKSLSEIAASNVISFEMLLHTYGGEPMGWVKGIYDDAEREQPESICQAKELQEVLTEGIQSLRENEQMVLSLYYEQELSMKEIAQVLGVSAPRVSQIHSRAIEKLRRRLEQYLDGGAAKKERNEADGKRILQPDVGHAVPEPAAGCGG